MVAMGRRGELARNRRNHPRERGRIALARKHYERVTFLFSFSIKRLLLAPSTVSSSVHSCHSCAEGMKLRGREKMMTGRRCYLDAALVPAGLLLFIAYHVWLWHKVRTQPLATVIGKNAIARRAWVFSIMKENNRKDIMGVQTLRNLVMGSTLMATTAILLSVGMAAFISSTYSVKLPVDDTVYGAHCHGEFLVSMKYAFLLFLFFSSFFCHCQFIGLVNEVCLLINTPVGTEPLATPEFAHQILERGFLLNMLGNRIFYAAISILLWIFGPFLVLFCFILMISVFYVLDFLPHPNSDNTYEPNSSFGR